MSRRHKERSRETMTPCPSYSFVPHRVCFGRAFSRMQETFVRAPLVSDLGHGVWHGQGGLRYPGRTHSLGDTGGTTAVVELELKSIMMGSAASLIHS